MIKVSQFLLQSVGDEMTFGDRMSFGKAWHKRQLVGCVSSQLAARRRPRSEPIGRAEDEEGALGAFGEVVGGLAEVLAHDPVVADADEGDGSVGGRRGESAGGAAQEGRRL